MSLRPHLDNYHALVRMVDDLCARITAAFPDLITCRAGCSSCCRHLTLSPIEALAMKTALAELTEPQQTRIRQRAATGSEENCPLLDNHICLLYTARPIICRTHGLPILARENGAARVDFCPLNFQGLASLPGTAVIDLDRLNETLAAINALYVAQSGGTDERRAIAQALADHPDMHQTAARER